MSVALEKATPIARQVRAYFAPVLRDSGTAAVFDPSRHDPSAPGAPWVDLGPIDSFQRTAGTRHESLYAGAKSAVALQARSQLQARVECNFRQWGKLQMALSGGSQHMNVLAAVANSELFPSGGTPRDPISVLPASTPQELVFGASGAGVFAVGDVLAVDIDYQQQTGYVGSGIAGAYVRDAAAVLHDPHYVRRVTFNIGRVAARTETSIILAQPLIGGVPAVNAGAQKVVAFVDREGGSFFQEWSALFVVEDENGTRICFHYPRLQPAAPAREAQTEIEKPLAAWSLHGSFLALPTTDINDGEQVLCYRSYFPAAAAALY